MTIGDRSESPDVPASLVHEMRRYILSIAREFHLAVGHGLSRKVLFLRSLHLKPKQREAYDRALKSPVSEGIFDEGESTFFFTEHGHNVLYRDPQESGKNS